MVRGDNQAASARSKPRQTAEESEEDADDSAVRFVEQQRSAFEDPGDREQPLLKHSGDPWEPDINDIMRARRLETRKFIVSHSLGANIAETFYRIDRFRRYLPKRGSDSSGLVQFWGPKATRNHVAGQPVPDWTVQTERAMHTVVVGTIEWIRRR